MRFAFAPGIYEALLNEEIPDLLQRHPELRSVFGMVDPEEEPGRYVTFLAGVIERALQQEQDPGSRLELCNRLIELLSGRENGAIYPAADSPLPARPCSWR